MNSEETVKELQLISRRLRNARKKKGLTQLELSLQAGVSQNMIACVKEKKRNPTFQTVIKMCRALDVQLSDILKDIEPSAKTPDTENRNKIKKEIIWHLNAVINLIDEL